jgi:hypothetical protein
MTSSLDGFMQCRNDWNKEFELRKSKVVLKKDKDELEINEWAQRSRA